MDQKLLARWLRETDRPPLPPGDEVSWSALTSGTLLDGVAWPGWADQRPGGLA